jgi:hypothetical protein
MCRRASLGARTFRRSPYGRAISPRRKVAQHELCIERTRACAGRAAVPLDQYPRLLLASAQQVAKPYAALSNQNSGSDSRLFVAVSSALVRMYSRLRS